MQELKGKKLVLFGAGRSGEIFAEHAKGLEVLAFADNDVKKQGQQLMGFPIIAPERIAESGCEVIVVTTVCPTQRIVEQLISLGLGDIPLITPDKAVLKGTQNHPFSHPLTKQIARELIVALDELASRAGVDLYLDYGTLLGAFREQDFIAWDDDIDMSVKDEQLDALLVLVQKDKSWLPQYPGVEWSVQVVTAGTHRLGVLISFDNAPGERCVLPLELAVTNRVVRDGQSVMSGKMLEFFCPASFFDGHDTVEFFGRRFKTPVNPTGYLDFIYGDWRKPKQNMSFSEYQGIREVPQDQVEEINYQKLWVFPVTHDQLYEMGKAGMDYQGTCSDSSAIFSVDNLPILQSLTDALEGRHLLVTGGTGFFGRWLLALFQTLQSRGTKFEVTVVSRDPERFLMHWPTFRGCRWLHWVANDVRLIPSSLSVDLVVHAAADTSAVGQRDSLELFDIITEGARRVCKLAVECGARRVLLIGSGAQYGLIPAGLPVTENFLGGCDSTYAGNAYAEAKRAQEVIGSIYAKDYGLDVIMARCFAFSGPGLPLDGHFAIGNFVRDALYADAIVLNSSGQAMRSYLHGADLAGWLLTLLLHGESGQAYNVGSDHAISIADLAHLVAARIAPYKPVCILGQANTSERSFYVPDISRARGLGLDVWTTLNASIDSMAHWGRGF